MNIREKITTLKARLSELKPITSKGFETSEELQKYIDENRHIYEETHNIQKEIRQLEWDILTPEEQSKKKEQRRLSKLKREGKL